MSDRAAGTGHEGATVCPFVAFQDDRERRATDPDHRHRCYAEPLPAPRATAHQRRYCLSPEFPACPIFQDWAIRAAATGVSMPSARRVSGPPAPIAPGVGGASASNGRATRTPEWAAPPPWVAAAHGGDAGTNVPRGQLTAFGDEKRDDADVAEAPGAAAPAATAPTGTAPPIRSTAIAGAAHPPGPIDEHAPHPASVSASDSATERLRTGRGFAYDLLAGDPAFAEPPPRDDAADFGGVDLPGGRNGRTDAPASGYLPPAAEPYPAPPAAASPYALSRDGPPVAARAEPHPPPPARTTAPVGLPEPEYLPPVKQMATPAGRAGPTGAFDGERDWERPRRFEAYPTLRTRVGMPGMPQFGRLPPVAVGAIALMLAAAILFALPGLFAGGRGVGEITPRPSASVRPSVSVAPTATPAPTPQVYTVKKGDTFSGIARQFGLTIEELKAANPQIKNINALRIGDRINIPDQFASPSAGATGDQEPAASPTEQA